MPRKLRVDYRTEDSFRREYAQNISKGGLFIPTKNQLEVRERIEIELVLSFRDESIILPGEVVHSIAAEMAETGAQPGVAIQFMVSADELRSKLAVFAPSSPVIDERSQGAGRRVAQRSRARVAVQVRVGKKSLEGHTRNLSSSGALISLPGAPIAIGKSLEVHIHHPAVDESLSVPGKVARHVEASGVTCVGVQFQVPEAREQEVVEFINRLRGIEHSRRLGGINGPIADLGIHNVLKMFGTTAPLGMLTLTRGPDEGYVTIEDGQLRAQLGSLIGREALDELLGWTAGSFEFEAQVDDGLVDGAPIPVGELGEAAATGSGPPSAEPLSLPEVERDETPTADASLSLVDLDELDLGLDLDDEPSAEYEEADEALAADSFSAGAEEPESDLDFEVEVDVDDAELGDELDVGLDVDAAPISPDDTLCPLEGDRSDLTKTEEAILDLAAVGMTVAKVVEIIPESEAEIHAALASLVDEGLLSLG